MLIGTAGHVDHGKTTLVRALTGIDCDRLEEEKQRGITIELGFARWDLGSRAVSVVDVPGHERLVRTMLVGAGGFDAVLLAVSATSGVMPQTREHLNACGVLGIERGVVALTFADRVDDLDGAVEGVRAGLADTPLASAEIIPVAAPSGVGLEELTSAMARVLAEVPPRDASAAPCLPIDRVFTIGGFGTVVTGTLWRGTLRVGDQVALRPGPDRVRVRGLQVHGQAVASASPGNRVAVNLDVPRDLVIRGAWVAGPDSIATARVLDVELRWLGHNPRSLRRRRGLTLHIGAERGLADVRADVLLEPGAQGTARIRLDRPIAVPAGARFVLRGDPNHNYGAVVGGGRVLDPLPPRRRGAAGRAQLAQGQDSAAWDQLRTENGRRGLGLEQLRQRWPRAPISFARFGPQQISVEVDRILAKVRAFHAARSDLPGMPPGTLTRDDLARAALDSALKSGQLRRAQGTVQLPDHAAKLADVDQGLARKVMRAIGKAGFDGQTQKAIFERFPADNTRLKTVTEHLIRQGRVVKSGDLYFPAREVRRLASQAAQATLAGERLPVAWLKKTAGVSRRQAIPLWTWLDREGVTHREGDARVAGPKAHEFTEPS